MLLQRVNTQARGRLRISTNTLRPQNDQEIVPRDDENSSDYVFDNPPESALRYFKSPQERNEQNRVVLVTSEDDFNGVYGKPTPSTRRSDVNRSSIPKSASSSTRSKEVTSKETVQTIRNYSKVNDDGSFTFGKNSFQLTI